MYLVYLISMLGFIDKLDPHYLLGHRVGQPALGISRY